MAADDVIRELGRSREEALDLVQSKGLRETRALLKNAERELTQRLRTAEGLSGPGRNSFTAGQLRATLAHVHGVLRSLTRGMRSSILDNGREAARAAGAADVKHLRSAQREFEGVGSALPIREAPMFDAAVTGTESSLLRRLAVTDKDPGVLGRYGVTTIQHFETELQQSLLTRRSWDDVRDSLISRSPFLQQAPAHWAERIVRTELSGAYNRAHWESMREANAQLGDMVKILSAAFDDRTAADSYVVHGQIRRPEEAFETWYGLMQHPPARPNDRETVVPHRISWPLPPSLRWRPRSQVVARWRSEGRRGSPPATPTMTTVPLASFGRAVAPRGRG
jgi:hypothetical protein